MRRENSGKKKNSNLNSSRRQMRSFSLSFKTEDGSNQINPTFIQLSLSARSLIKCGINRMRRATRCRLISNYGPCLKCETPNYRSTSNKSANMKTFLRKLLVGSRVASHKCHGSINFACVAKKEPRVKNKWASEAHKNVVYVVAENKKQFFVTTARGEGGSGSLIMKNKIVYFR